MDLRDLWRALTRRWWAVLGCLVLAGAAAYGYIAVTPAVYQASSEIVLIANSPTTIGETAQGVSTTTQLAETAATIIDSPALLEAAATDDYSAQRLADMISVTSRTLTSTIDIVAMSDSPATAAQAANAAAQAAQDELPALLGADGESGDLPLAVTVLREAAEPSAPFSPDAKGVMVIAVALGLCAGIAAALVIDVLRRRPA
ncbi:YveK family protein [Demequina sp. NBRC 110051]|uniref:YveK family protein n=1 Tax=Demequina sp. NBRC 110051 TaxID=1570340 RepID=UPI000A05121F|nr:Wzz/FepE/Etk N-terminal domain-containing protein [Demequina sp. NBRC 110051]